MLLRSPTTPGAQAHPAQRRHSAAPASRLASRRVVQARGLPEVDATTAAYWALGAGGLSFVGTFGLAPLFKKQLKEDIDWPTMYGELVAGGGVPSISPSAAYVKRKSAALVDVRLGLKYEKGHPDGALSLPLYIPIQGWGPAATARRIGFSFFGIYGTQLNTSFAEDALAVLPKGREVIVVCESGGSLTNKPGTLYGFPSRSLKAAYYLQKAGYKVSYVQGGIQQWTSDGLPLVAGPEDGEEDDGGDDGGSGEGKGLGLKLPALTLSRRR